LPTENFVEKIKVDKRFFSSGFNKEKELHFKALKEKYIQTSINIKKFMFESKQVIEKGQTNLKQ
jgi:hypothetical protein